MGLTMEAMGFAKALSYLIFCKKRLLLIFLTILKNKFSIMRFS